MFSSPGSLSVSDLNRGPTSGFAGGGAFGQAQSQQQQPGQQQQPQAQQGFGLGQQQPQQQMHQQHGQQFGSLFSPAQQQHHQQQQPQQQFGQAQPNAAFGGGYGAASHMGSGQHNPSGNMGLLGGVATGAGIGQTGYAQPGPQGAATSAHSEYLPGYLSKLKESRPYSSPLDPNTSPRSPPRTRDHDSAAASGTPFGGDRLRSSRGDLQPNSAAGGGLSSSAGGAGGGTSPNQRFSSSFFSSTSPGRGDQDSPIRGSIFSQTGAGSSSIFGPAGLRSKANSSATGRRSVAFGRSPSISRGLRQSRSPPASSSMGPPGAAGDEDDDAPPIESLGEDSEMGDSSFVSGGYRGRDESYLGRSAGATAAADSANTGDKSTATTSGKTNEDPAYRTILVFGMARSLEAPVLEQFSNFGAVESTDWISLSGGGASGADGYLEIVYKESWAALRALRRNGEMIAGICLVGVKWKDENLQREMLINGLSSAAFSQPGAAGANGITTSSAAPAASSVLTTSKSSSSPMPGRSATPGGRSQVGRPMSVIGNRDAVFAPSPAGAKGGNAFAQLRNAAWGSSPAPSNGALQTTQASTPTAQQGGGGMLGKLSDVVFGW